MKILFVILMIYSHETCNLVGNMVTMKEIPLTRGKVALVDDDMYDYLMQWKWHVHINESRFYARANAREGDKTAKFLMHRLITSAPKGILVDHKNGNGLDNQKHNLRLCTSSENSRNTKTHKDSKSGFKGVYWIKTKKTWRVAITVNYKRTHLGYFKSLTEAIEAYNEAVIKYHGEFAVFNQIPA